MVDRRQRGSGPKGAKPIGVTKQRKGISVGRALPDGPQRRKVQQVKREMIEKAKLKKQYAKLKGGDSRNTNDIPHLGDSRVSPDPLNDQPPPQERLEDVSEVEWSDEDEEEPEQPILAEHAPRNKPNRSSAEELEVLEKKNKTPRDEKAHRKPKPQPFQKEEREADRRKREAEERREAREQANRERIQKLDERDRFRKAMAKARTGGRNGQRKLGRESQVLLERVQRMVGQ